jgi:FkbM family methyltransferase
MFQRLLSSIRHRFHPFHQLKRSRLFSRYILPPLDRPLSRRLHGVNWPVRLRLMRHLSYVVDNRTVEPGICALFTAICRTFSPTGFWDVGSNIGFYTWLVLSECPGAKAVMYEPDPVNLGLIRETISRNKIDRVDVRAVAVADAAGELEFVVDAVSGFTGGLDLSQTTYVEEHYGLEQAKIKVPTVTLDAELESAVPPSLVKIDVEEAEHLAFAGAGRLMSEIQPIIIFECSPENFSPLTEQLRQWGYDLLSAEAPDETFDGAPNVLAIPKSLAGLKDQFMENWRAEYIRWTGR